MNERRVVQSPVARCPDCGGSEAIVRIRGNGCAVTCTACRSSAISPMLDPDELVDLLGECDPVEPVSIMRAPSVLPERHAMFPCIADRDLPDLRALSVRFTLPTP